VTWEPSFRPGRRPVTKGDSI